MLNEAVEAFLRQDYENREMWILNDDPRVDYVFEHPKVRIINEKKRYDCLGDKWNAMMKMQFEYDPDGLSLDWPDDDISLPSFISIAVKYLGDRDVWTSSGRFFLNMVEGNMIYEEGVNFDPVLTKKGFDQFKFKPGWGEDVTFFHSAGSVTDLVTREETCSIYRWGTGHYHLSGYGIKGNGWDKIKEVVEKKMPPGTYKIEPGWKHDYIALAKAVVVAD